MAAQDDDLQIHPVLRMDAIRIATLVVLSAVTLSVVGLIAYLVVFVQAQRETGECYQRQIDALTVWAATAVDAGKSDRQAQRELLLSEGPLVDRLAARDRYLARLDEADRTRSSAPVPRAICGAP